MDSGQHLVTTLVCFVNAEGEGGFCPGGFCQGGGSRPGAYVLHPVCGRCIVCEDRVRSTQQLLPSTRRSRH